MTLAITRKQQRIDRIEAVRARIGTPFDATEAATIAMAAGLDSVKTQGCKLSFDKSFLSMATLGLMAKSYRVMSWYSFLAHL